MKTNHLIKQAILFLTLISLSSCAVVGGIFKTGMGVGVIIVIAVIGLLLFLFGRSGKS